MKKDQESAQLKPKADSWFPTAAMRLLITISDTPKLVLACQADVKDL
jgi:hypothetical protein